MDIQSSETRPGDAGKIPVGHRPLAAAQSGPHPEFTEVPVAHRRSAEAQEEHAGVEIAPEIPFEIRQECRVKSTEFEGFQQGR